MTFTYEMRRPTYQAVAFSTLKVGAEFKEHPGHPFGRRKVTRTHAADIDVHRFHSVRGTRRPYAPEMIVYVAVYVEPAADAPAVLDAIRAIVKARDEAVVDGSDAATERDLDAFEAILAVLDTKETA